MVLHIITRCSKPSNLLKIKQSIKSSIEDGYLINWHIIFDTSILKDIDAELLADLNLDWIYLSFKSNASQYSAINKAIENIQGETGFIYILDDDNTLHRKLAEALNNLSPSKDVLIFSQRVGGFEQNHWFKREASVENIRPTKIDKSQYAIKKQYFKKYKFQDNYLADGLLISEIYRDSPDLCQISDEILAYGNSLSKDKKARNPRVLYIGKDKPILKTNNPNYWESSELEVLYITDDSDLYKHINEFKPDSILTSFENERDLRVLWDAPFEIRKMWINQPQTDERSGEIAYNNAMLNMLQIDRTHLISFFTPIYNTGEKLRQAYKSLQDQTYKNWEWILVNDSSDGGTTLKIAEDIAKNDPRVKVYDFREKSGGLIGEVKWRACCMTRGEILVELDHDDIVTPDCAEILMKAAEKHPEIGFFYSDCVEAREDWSSMMYNDGFACGYGKYKKESAFEKEFDVCIMPNINPKTIRHIVGVPNHIRAWRRHAYFAAGGHCRNLTITDDYELLVRTFLTTKMMRIPKLLYVQFFYNDGNEMNTQDLTRQDIQRRVKTIARIYNDAIKRRFEELGKEDWAYNEIAELALDMPSRYGEAEGYVNETFVL